VRRSVIPLVLLAALSFGAGLGRGAVTDADEAFYAESAREMVESGDWLTPHYNYEPRFQKPALYYWLVAATYVVTGPNEIAARVWSALAGVGLVVIIAAAGRRWFDEEVGLLAAAIGATNFGYFAMARMALPDLPLTFFITLSIYAALVAMLDRERYPRRWLLLAAVATALGFLTKGPVALILPAIVVGPVVLLERRSTNVGIGDFVLALLLFLVIALPWYVAMWLQHGAAYLDGFFLGDNYERFATARFNDPRPWWFYLPVLAGGLLPWTPLMFVWWSPLVRFLSRRGDIDTLDLRLLMWAALPLIFYTVSVGKQPRYVLPVLPPLALLLAGSIVERTRDWRSLDGARVRSRRSSAVVFGSALSGLFLITLGYLIVRVHALFVDVGDLLTIGTGAVIALAGAVVVMVSLTRAWRAAPVVLALATALVFAVLPYGVLSAPRDSSAWRMAQMVRAANLHGSPVATYGALVRNMIFYSGTRQVDVIDDAHLAEFAAANPNALVVLPLDDLDRLQSVGSLQFEPLASIRYFDEGQIKVRTLLRPNLDEDLRTVVLARVR
jgi:4-amino-4-deoxy-L-arabinose transferase-like glycosyltransferase